MKNLAFCLWSLLALLFSGCETVVDLDLEPGAPRLAVEAILTNVPQKSFVQLHLSAPYSRHAAPSPVTDARVLLSDDAGNSIAFSSGGQGLYLPPAGFKGVEGRSYQLTIQARGQTYTASSVLHPVPELEEVKYEYVDGKDDPYGRKEGYYILTSFRDPPQVRNYYKLDLVVNDTLRQRHYSEVLITDDRFYDGSHLQDLHVFIGFKKGDALQVNLLSLTKEAYEFYAAINAMAAQAGLFGRNPANLPTNISNGALGFFSASAMSSQSLLIR